VLRINSAAYLYLLVEYLIQDRTVSTNRAAIYSQKTIVVITQSRNNYRSYWTLDIGPHTTRSLLTTSLQRSLWTILNPRTVTITKVAKQIDTRTSGPYRPGLEKNLGF